MKEIYYLCREKAKIGITWAQSNKFVSALGLHYLCAVFIKIS